MPGLPNYRRILGPKNIVEDREIADEYGRTAPTFAITSGSGVFGNITEATDEDFVVEFTPPVGDTGIPAVEQLVACYAVYEGDAGAFSTTSVGPITGLNVSLSDGEFVIIPVGVTGLFPPSVSTLVIEALAADDGVEKTGTISIYTRISEVGEAGPVMDPDSLVLTIALSKTYTAP